MPIFTFPDDPRWNEDIRAVQFTVKVGEYSGTVSIHRKVFQQFVPSPTEQSCIEAFYQQRTSFERIVEAKITQRQLTEDGQIDVTIRDLALAGLANSL